MKNSKIIAILLSLALITGFAFAQGRTETTVEEEYLEQGSNNFLGCLSVVENTRLELVTSTLQGQHSPS